MEFLTSDTFRTLSNPGVDSVQLISPKNSASQRLAITRVTVAPGALQMRHVHPSSEQVWLALEGRGLLLLDGRTTVAFELGHVVRFADGDIHGFQNDGPSPFTYIAITAPPIDFASAYKEDHAP